MKIISHRGNIDGYSNLLENSPKYIQYALSLGFDVEIDVWYINDKLFLGHDKPTYLINPEFLFNDRLWVHCKNIEALFRLHKNPLANIFFHNNDDCTLTKTGYIWTYPNDIIPLTPISIAVLPETVHSWDISCAFGICTDFPKRYKNELK